MACACWRVGGTLVAALEAALGDGGASPSGKTACLSGKTACLSGNASTLGVMGSFIFIFVVVHFPPVKVKALQAATHGFSFDGKTVASVVERARQC